MFAPEEIMYQFVDLHRLGTRGNLVAFIPYLKDPEYRQDMSNLMNAAFTSRLQKEAVTFLEFWSLFFHNEIEIPLSDFLQLCPRQKHRPYTIASSSVECPTSIHLAVGLIHEEHKISLQDLARECAS